MAATPISRNLDNVPEELRQVSAWVLWRYETRDGKPTKVPYRISGERADTSRPETWTMFEEARRAHETDDFFHGVGFVFHHSNPYAGADLDHVAEEEARTWLDAFDSYAERSPSGDGFHIICKAELPTGTKKSAGELYSTGRFFTVTGDVVRNAPIREAQEAAEKFFDHLRAGDDPGPSRPPSSASPTMTDAEVVRRAQSAKNAERFQAVYEGGGDYASASERDMSLARLLAFWTQDREQIERIMRGSALARPKWNKHRTYLRDTIEKAVGWCQETYGSDAHTTATLSPNGNGDQAQAAASGTAGPAFERFARVDLASAIVSPAQRPPMVAEEMLYAGRVHGIYAAGGQGKTWMAVEIIERVIRQGKDIVFIDQENGERIVSDRLRDVGADPETVRRHLHYVPFPSMDLSGEALAEFVALLEEIRPALVVIDSWINCLAAAGLDENSAVDIARWAEAYPQQARKRGMAVLILDHVPKEGGSARGSGRKLDYVDVMFELRNPLKFDRENIGRIDLYLRKDREGWLPRVLAFRIGGGEDGFVFEPFTGMFPSADDATGLLPSDRTTLDALRSFGERGATDSEWRREAMERGLARSTYYKSKETLIGLAHVEKVASTFSCKTLAKPGSTEVHSESNETA